MRNGIGNDRNGDVFARLLEDLDEQIARGAGRDDIDASAITDDPDLLALWDADRRCLELLHRVCRADSTLEAEATLSTQASICTPGGETKQRIGRFQIHAKLGHGGLGVVYLAYDPKLSRQVALKVPRLASLVSDDLRMRFIREAEAAARLNHPYLIAVYESGEEDGACYIASEYCPGPTLETWLHDRREPVPVRMAAALVRRLAEGVGHAHGRGVLHRDIKPSNVLLASVQTQLPAPGLKEACSVESLHSNADRFEHPAAEPWPKLADFGMAKLLEREGEETRSGALVGTPAYMAPEQARGKVRELDARTDVYALGAILYEVLTGRRVFETESEVEALRHVLFEEPNRPTRLRPGIPRDLEAICLKCLAKSSEARYPTALQLVDDLDRFLAGKPTEARPLSAVARTWKWARRRPAVATLAVAVATAAVTIFGLVIGYNSRLAAEVARAEHEAEARRRLLYTADVRVAYESLRANNVVQALDALNRQIPAPGEEDLREFAWHYLRTQCGPEVLSLTGHRKPVMAVAFAPQGHLLASGGGDGAVRLWDVATGKSLRVLRDNTTEVTCLAFDPEGHVLAAGNEAHTVRLWDPATGERGRALKGHLDEVLAVCFSPDGTHVTSGGNDRSVRVWDVADGTAIKTLEGGLDVIQGLGYSPDGTLLFAVDEAEQLHVWQTEDWKQLRGELLPREKLFALSVSSDGKRLAAAGRREVIYEWDLVEGQVRLRRELVGGHKAWIQSLAYSPAGDVLASAGKEGVLRLWELDAMQPSKTLLGHRKRIWSVAWSPDGKHLATASADETVKIWSVASSRVAEFRAAPTTIHGDIAISPDGSKMIVGSADGFARIWDARTHALVREFPTYAESVRKLQISRDGKLLATRSADSTTRVWELDSARLISSRQAESGSGTAVAWHPASRILAASVKPAVIELLDTKSDKVIRQLNHPSKIQDMVFTPDGRFLISSSNESLRIWDAAEGVMIREFEGAHSDMALTPEGQYVAIARESNVTMVDIEKGQQVATIVTQGADVWDLAISPDGRTLAAVTRQPNEIGLWDLDTRHQLMRLPRDAVWISGVQFTPDGNCLAACGVNSENEGVVWKWEIGKR